MHDNRQITPTQQGIVNQGVHLPDTVQEASVPDNHVPSYPNLS